MLSCWPDQSLRVLLTASLLVMAATTTTAAAAAVRVELLSEEAALVPGQTAHLGVHFRLTEPWHIYWDGLNDTGFAPRIVLDLPDHPDGFTSGPVQWPAPERHVTAGMILDHIYHGSVLLILPVQVPAQAEIGTEVSISCRVDWLACAGICVPGRQELTLSLPVTAAVAGSGVAGPKAALFRQARHRLPRDLDAAGAQEEATGLSWEWHGDTLTLRAEGATELVFMPRADCGRLVDLIVDGAATGETLRIRFRAGDAGPGPARGVIAVTTGDGRQSFWNLDTTATSADE